MPHMSALQTNLVTETGRNVGVPGVWLLLFTPQTVPVWQATGSLFFCWEGRLVIWSDLARRISSHNSVLGPVQRHLGCLLSLCTVVQRTYHCLAWILTLEKHGLCSVPTSHSKLIHPLLPWCALSSRIWGDNGAPVSPSQLFFLPLFFLPTNSVSSEVSLRYWTGVLKDGEVWKKGVVLTSLYLILAVYSVRKRTTGLCLRLLIRVTSIIYLHTDYIVL
jgi:hypothetical protein